MMDTGSAIFDDLTTLGRQSGCALLERQELTVSELCAVLRLPQSTVSRHLRRWPTPAGELAA
jgi:DNA-binding transcriptional ArsR family regulator